MNGDRVRTLRELREEMKAVARGGKTAKPIAEKESAMPADLPFLFDGKWDEGTRPKDLFELHVKKQPSTYVQPILDGLRSGKRRVENGCAQLASLLSEAEPALLYPHLQVFSDNLSSKEPVLRWEAACTLGNLAAADTQRKLVACIPGLTKLLSDKSIVLQGHAVKALAKVARAFPDEGRGILEEFLKARSKFPGNGLGYLVDAMEVFVERSDSEKKIRSFLVSCERSEISSVAKRAKRILKLLDR